MSNFIPILPQSFVVIFLSSQIKNKFFVDTSCVRHSIKRIVCIQQKAKALADEKPAEAFSLCSLIYGTNISAFLMTLFLLLFIYHSK
jgi:hypothetical protein